MGKKMFLYEHLCQELGLALSPKRGVIFIAPIPILKSKEGGELFEEDFFISLPKKIKNKEEEKKIWDSIVSFCGKINESKPCFSGVGILFKMQDGCFLSISGTYYDNHVEYRVSSRLLRSNLK